MGGEMCVPVPLQIFRNWDILRPHKVETAFCSHCGMSKPIHSSSKPTDIFCIKAYDYKNFISNYIHVLNHLFILFHVCFHTTIRRHYWKIREEHEVESKRLKLSRRPDRVSLFSDIYIYIVQDFVRFHS